MGVVVFVLIPYSSGMGVGLETMEGQVVIPGLNTLFVRYGCGTHGERCPRRECGVLIPYSSGMGVGPGGTGQRRPCTTVLIPYSSGMGVGPPGPSSTAGDPGS